MPIVPVGWVPASIDSSGEVFIDNCVVASVFSVWLFSMVFNDGCDGKFWLGSICEDSVGTKWLVVCCSDIGEDVTECEAEEYSISLLSAVVGNNDPFCLWIIDEDSSGRTVLRVCWSVKNDCVMDIEPDDTFVSVSLNEGNKLWFGRIDDARIGWKVLTIACSVTEGIVVASDVWEMTIDVLFVDDNKVWFQAIDDNGVGKVIFEVCSTVKNENLVNLEPRDEFLCVSVANGEKLWLGRFGDGVGETISTVSWVTLGVRSV